MSAPTRFPNGITNVTTGSPLGDYIALDPSRVHQYFDDFDYYNPDDWDLTVVGSSTPALIDADGGVLRLETSAGASDNVVLDKKGASFVLESGKKLFVKAKFSMTDPSISFHTIGLFTASGHGMILRTYPGSATVNFTTTIGFQSNITPIVSAEPNIPVDVAFVYDGEGEFLLFSNDQLVAKAPDILNIEGGLFTCTMSVQNDSAVSTIMDLDYLFVSKER